MIADSSDDTVATAKELIGKVTAEAAADASNQPFALRHSGFYDLDFAAILNAPRQTHAFALRGAQK
jgi:hypothetical protein